MKVTFQVTLFTFPGSRPAIYRRGQRRKSRRWHESRTKEECEVSHSFVVVLKLVLAQLTEDVNVMTAFGTGNVDAPKVIDWCVAFTVKSAEGTVPCSLK